MSRAIQSSAPLIQKIEFNIKNVRRKRNFQNNFHKNFDKTNKIPNKNLI
jgi:hypothetical protein